VEKPRGDGGLGFHFTVNGEKVFIRGVNWTPSDAIFARVDD